MAAHAHAAPVPATQAAEPQLKRGAIGFLSNLVIGVASTAPGYSLAATLGFVAAIGGMGFHSPAIMLAAFVPMLCIAVGYNYLNRADPDCGTTFSWGTRAMGPWAGWMGGWAIIVADIIVMANLAQIAATYTFLLFSWSSAAKSVAAVTIAGVVWIAVMTWVCWRGIELSARLQQFLLAAEFVTLTLFAVVALVKVYANNPAHAVHVSEDWFNPFSIHSFNAFIQGILLAVFIYWGWDSGVSVNEETENSSRAPGRAAILSTLLLLGAYLLVTVAAQAFAGPKALAANSSDIFAGGLAHSVLGSGLDKLLIIAVLTSASASTQTTILPTARTSLSMARQGAIPRAFARIHPRFRTPDVSTLAMGAISIVWFVVIVNVSTNVLSDSITALGFGIAFYYGLTGFACAIYFRRELTRSVRNFVFVGLVPALGGTMLFYVFVRSFLYNRHPSNTLSKPVLGIGTPVVVGIGSLLLGLLVMLVAWRRYPAFFRRRPEVADPAVLADTNHAPGGPPAPAPAGAGM